MAKYLFTSRLSGNSTGEFAELNLGDHVGDLPVHVEANRARLQKSLSLNRLVFMQQSHGTEIFTVDASDPTTIEADALITSERGVGLAVLTADCIPLLIDAGNWIAAVHVGRKGLVSGIIPRVIDSLRSHGARSMKAWLGPAICGKCYEVSPEMYQEVIREFPAAATSVQSHCLDLPAAAITQLREFGVPTQNFHRCTLESPHYYSYRRQSITGRMAGVISL